MEIAIQLAKHIRSLYFGKNWTAVSFKETLADVDWEEASKQMGDCNSILTLVHHTTYYMKVQLPVFDGGELVASDKDSFIHDPMTSAEDWEAVKNEMFQVAETYASKIESLPENIFDKSFADEKYGSYYRNLQGVIEHSHYHLGQIVLVKKLL